MNKIASRAHFEKMKGDILSISSRAKACAKQYKDTIDGSIGAFYGEDKNLVLYTDVKEYLENEAYKELAYASCLGGENYQKAVLSFLLGPKYEEYSLKYDISFSATLGGTGAITLAFNMYLEELDTVLIPDPSWPNYELLARNAKVSHSSYNLISKEGKFDVADLKRALDIVFKTQKRAFIIINDPAENPTGYSMSEEDLTNLKNLLDSYDREIVVLFDIAYLHYGPKDPTYIFEFADSLKPNVLSLFAFSLSKTLSVYGMRGGALFGFTDKNQKWEFDNSINAMIRGTYSCPNSLAVGVASSIFLDESKVARFKQELESNVKLLQLRVAKMVDGLKGVGYKVIEATSSFYVTFYTDNAYDLADKLEVQHIFLVPLNEHMMRVAVSGLSLAEIEKLPQLIRRYDDDKTL